MNEEIGSPVVTKGWYDVVENLPILLQNELAREFGRRRVGIVSIVVLSGGTRPLNGPCEAGVMGPGACVEEVRISVWLRVGKESVGKSLTRCYAYQRGLVEYNGNRTGGRRFSLIENAGAEVKGEGGLSVSLGEVRG